MWTSTVILSGTVVVEGVAFRWWVTDGYSQRLTVAHPKLGMRTEQLFDSPEARARTAAREMLAGEVSVPALDVVDDVVVGAREHTIVPGSG